MTKNFTKIWTRAVMTLLLMVSAATTAWAQSALEEDVVVFEDAADNTDAIAALNGQTKTVVIKGRTLKAGHWNPIHLPFLVAHSRKAEFFGAGVVIRVINTEDYSDDGTTVKIVLWDQMEMYPNRSYIVFIPEGEDIIDPVFRDVKIEYTKISFSPNVASLVGVYKPTTLDKSKGVLLLEDDDFYYPDPSATINAFRSYIKLPKNVSESARIIVDFGDGHTSVIEPQSTAIESVKSTDGTDGAWYTLTGIQLEGEPTAPGIYVKDGKKVAIK